MVGVGERSTRAAQRASKTPCALRAVAIACALSLWLGPWVRHVDAEEISVPISLQVELLDRLLRYERGLQRSAERTLNVLIVTRTQDNESARAAAQVGAQLERAKTLAGKAVAFTRVSYESAAQIKKLTLERRAYLVYLAPGLEEVVGALAAELRGQRVLTVSCVAGDVARGAVLAFELSSAKPRIALNLRRARDQKLDFDAQLLRIARVIP
jgi:hypothetical protein